MPSRSYQDPTDPQGRAPSLKGAIVVDTINGTIRMRAWPRKRPGPRNPTNEYWTDWLRQAMALYKYAQPSEKQIWQAALRGIPVKITDIYTAVMRGTMWTLVGPDATVYYPTQGRDKVSYSLDAITALPGALLIRGDSTWQGITPPTNAGQLLISTDDLSQWKSPQDAGIARYPISAQGTPEPSQTIPSGQPKLITWTAVTQDTSNPPIWTSAQPDRFTAPVDGTYTISASIHLTSAPEATDILGIQSNTTDRLFAQHTVYTGTHAVYLSIAGTTRLTAGDWLGVELSQSSGETVSIINGICTMALLG